MDGDQQESQATTVDNMAVVFYTDHKDLLRHHTQMPLTSFSVPLGTNPAGLTTLVNTVMRLYTADRDDDDDDDVPASAVQKNFMPLDFLLDGEYITVALDRFIRSRNRAAATARMDLLNRLQQSGESELLQDNDSINERLPPHQRPITTEQILKIEFKPAIQPQEGLKVPHDDWVACVRAPIGGNQELLVTGAYDHCVRLWREGECVSIGKGHEEAVKSIAILPGSVSALKDATSAKKKRTRTEASAGGLPSFLMVSTGKDGMLRTWEFHNGAHDAQKVGFESLTVSHPHGDAADTIAAAPGLPFENGATSRGHANNSFVATGSWDCAVRLFTWRDLLQEAQKEVRPVYSFNGHSRPVTAVAFVPGTGPTDIAHHLYSAGLDGRIIEWDVEKGELSNALGASADNKSAAHGKAADHAIQCLALRPPHQGGGSSVLCLTGHTDNRLRLYDPRSRSRGSASGAAHTWSGHRQWIYSVDWCWRQDDVAGSGGAIAGSTDGPLLVSASEDATVKVWDLRSTRGALATIDATTNTNYSKSRNDFNSEGSGGHTDGVLSVHYVGAGIVASGGKDNKTRTTSLAEATAALH